MKLLTTREQTRFLVSMTAAAVVAFTVSHGAAQTEGEDSKQATPAEYSSSSLSDLSTHLGGDDVQNAEPAKQASSSEGEEALPDLSDAPRALADLPSGGGAVSPQATALPSGPSSITGMGESFTTQLSTGIVSFSLPLQIPAARGLSQPALTIAYSSAAGLGVAGKGWSFGAAAISRQTDRGIPKYHDLASWHPEQDRFVFAGMELVPICTVSAGTCSGALQDEVMPAWANGWQYFRARIESGFLRFFWSPDHRTWRAQGKDGSNLELGVPLDGSGYDGGLQTNPERPSEIFRWHLVRQYDSLGDVNGTGNPDPVNSIVYRYSKDAGAIYLSDLYYTSPASDPTTQSLSEYAHHVRVAYEARPDVTRSYRSGWLVEHRLRLARVDVATKPFSGSVSSARVMTRRYHFGYESDTHTSLLLYAQMEGRCETPVVEQGDQTLPATTCPMLPALTFGYQRVSSTASRLRDANGYSFEPFDEQVRDLPESPPHSLDEELTGLMDVNADGLPDVVVTAPGLFGNKHGVFFNGLTSKGGFGFEALQTMRVERTGSVDASVLKLNNSSVATLDLDSDGIVNLLHMPFGKSYSVFSPEKSGSEWLWKGRQVAAASGQDIKIDFTSDARNTQVMDVNGDGLVDVVRSSPTEVQTFFSLGRYPGGHDQFGSATMTAAASASIRNDPVTACAPWSGHTLSFSDEDVRIADLNGDGLPDIARVRSGQILYWPGRGNGMWGTGSRTDCPGGELATNRHIEMRGAPRFGVTRAGALMMADVNADGLADLVEVRAQGVDIYLNDNGEGWTERHIIADTPFLPSASNYARLTDIDGTGTPDILWGRAYEYKYIDLTGGVVPHLLVKTANGLGSTKDLEYATTTEVMRQAKADGNPWTSFTPTVSPVLVRSTVRDHLEAVGRPAGVYVTEYSYRDPVYEGRQREFRGFREATVKTLGDENSPTSLTRSTFLLGECSEGFQGTAADVCSLSLRWQDNWREPLKGLPVLVETLDASGVYLSTEHTTFELRQLYTGLDGRRVTIPLPVAKDVYAYDTANFEPASPKATLNEVVANLAGITHTETREVVQRATAGTARLRTESVFDDYGNMLQAVRKGCVEGCPEGVDESIIAVSEFDRPDDDDSGWLWREVHAYVKGSVHTDHRNEVLRDYTEEGLLLETRAVLSGTLALDRFHESSATIAPAPPDASGGVASPVEIVVATNSYDAFGHVIFASGPNGRCTAGTLDALYKQLPVTATIYAGAEVSGCGEREFTHEITTYDRGLALAIHSLDAQDQPAYFEYDGFGRVREATFANPESSGNLAPYPTLIVDYLLPTDPAATPYVVTVAQTLDGADFDTSSYHETWSFEDGLGRTIAALSQADNEDAGDWVVGGAAEYNAKGGVARVWDPWFHDDTPQNFSLGSSPPQGPACRPTGSTFREYDAFGRVIATYDREDTLDAYTYHHALSQDVWDAADLDAGPHQGSYLTIVVDGHGRGVRRTARVHAGANLEERHVLNEYLPTGEVLSVTQRRTGSTDVVRWLRYDSLGRMVLNAEPNTSPNFDPDPTTPAGNIKAIRYAYDDAGDLVGFSDARGCGANFHYDAGGRLVAEDRSPCLDHHPAYTSPNLSTGNGTEAFYLYDENDPDSEGGSPPLSITEANLWGRLASVSSLGQKTIFSYDPLGRGIETAVRMAKPGAASSTLASRYAPRWYTRAQTLDTLDRPLTATTGATTTELLGTGNESEVTFTYGKRGLLRGIGGSYGTLFAGATYFADGAPDTATLGDGAATERSTCYDTNLRPETVMTYRAAAGHWSSPPSGYTPPGSGDYTDPLTLEYSTFSYDIAGNITEIEDSRTASEWPSSFKPVTRSFQYDDMYRLVQTTYDYAGTGSDSWTSPYDAENNDSSRTQPSPHVSFSGRVEQQNYQYDWLGNPEQTTDDQDGFWDRSLGEVTVGTANAGPNQLQSASNRTLASSSPQKGDLDVVYDDAGNVTGMVVRRDGTCLPSAASCWQRFHYEWDEVGQLTRARRWDLVGSDRTTYGDPTGALPTATPEADLRYAYDAGGGRTLKTAVDASSNERHTAYIFSTLEVRSTTWDTGASPPDYVLDAEKVQLRLPAGIGTARVVYSEEDLPTLTSGQQHVFIDLGDHLGSSSFVIDKETGELVEYSTYQAYGAAESDFRPGRWAEYREPYKFTGKEEDIEVGLTYFGARYYSPYLGVWMSPDAVTIHELGSDINPYAYVYGTPLMGVDPDGNNPLIAIGIAVAVYTVVTIENGSFDPGSTSWWKGAIITAGAAAAGYYAGAGVSAAATDAGAGTAVSGAAGGAAGGAASYATSSVLSGQGLGSGSGFARAIASGGASGLVGSGFSGESSGSRVGGAVASSSAGFVTNAALGGEASFQTFLLSLGSSVAGALASSPGAGPEPAGTSNFAQREPALLGQSRSYAPAACPADAGCGTPRQFGSDPMDQMVVEFLEARSHDPAYGTVADSIIEDGPEHFAPIIQRADGSLRLGPMSVSMTDNSYVEPKFYPLSKGEKYVGVIHSHPGRSFGGVTHSRDVDLPTVRALPSHLRVTGIRSYVVAANETGPYFEAQTFVPRPGRGMLTPLTPQMP